MASKVTLIIGHDWEFILTGSFCLLNTGISYQGVESTFREASIEDTLYLSRLGGSPKPCSQKGRELGPIQVTLDVSVLTS